MKAVKVNLSREFKSVEIHTLSDLHLGDRNCDFKKIAEKVREIEAMPNAYVILNGDLINNATTQSISDTYAEELTPMEQLKEAVGLFDPIRDRILAMTSGNHENRTYKADGIDLTEILARELGVSERYAPDSITLFLRVGDKANKTHQGQQICYVLYITHGSGGGRREGGKINRLADLASIIDADIYIHSHTHLPVIFKQSYYRVSPLNSSFALVDKMFVNTNAWLKYGGYGEAQGYKPASTQPPIIHLCGTMKKFSAKL